MKLKAVSVRNFRSYTNAKGEPPHRLALGDGLNVLIGPNNCGKSNLLRAVALALQDSGGVHFWFIRKYLAAELRPEHVRRWLEMITDIRKALGFKESAEGSDPAASLPEILPLQG